MNLAATHLIKALGILSLLKSMKAIHWSWNKGNGKHVHDNDSEDDSLHDESDEEGGGNGVDLNDDEYEVDIEFNMEIEATPDDVRAMLGMTITYFESGDVVKKLMAFVDQLRASSEPT